MSLENQITLFDLDVKKQSKIEILKRIDEASTDQEFYSFTIDCQHDKELSGKCLRLLSTLSTKVISLNVLNVSKDSWNKEKLFVNPFSKLKHLYLEYIEVELSSDMDDLLQLIGTDLKTFYADRVELSDGFLKCLKKNCDLEEITTKSCTSYITNSDKGDYACEPDEFKFHLNHLEIHSDESLHRSLLGMEYKYMLRAFLHSQASTLRTLVLVKTKLKIVEKALRHLKNLHTFKATVILSENYDIAKAVLPVNFSIRNLTVDLSNFEEQKTFIEAIPNLETFHADVISIDLRNYVSINRPALKLITPLDGSLIFLWPEKLQQLLFQHMTQRDVLTLFEVSRVWCTKVESSKQLMSKVVLKPTVRLIRDPSANSVFKKCRRKYQNAIVDFINSKDLLLDFINTHEYSYVSPEHFVSFEASNINFFWSGNWYEFDRMVVNNIRHIKFKNVDYRCVQFLLYFAGSRAENIHFESLLMTTKFVSFFKKCEALKELKLINCVGYDISPMHKLHFKFKLEKLTVIQNKCFDRQGDVCKSIICPLLQSCTDSLTELDLGVNNVDVVNFVLNNMRNLKILSIAKLWQSILDNVKMSRHLHLKKLKMLRTSSITQFRSFLTADEIEYIEVQSPNSKSFDPLIEIPDNLHEMILQHLNDTDILSISTVSKTWWNFTAESETCMEKLVLRVWDDSVENYDIKILKKSKRKYQNVSCRTFKSDQFLNASSSNVKYEINVKSLLTLQYFSSSLKTICIPNEEISNVNYKDMISEIVDFPNLEVLNIGPYESTPRAKPAWYDEFWRSKMDEIKFLECFSQNTKNLKTFKLCGSLSERDLAGFRELLRNNKKLKNLLISNCQNVQLLFVNHYRDEFDFKLEKLEIPFDEKFSIQKTDVEKRFKGFLESQTELESVSLVSVSGPILNTVINKIKQLKFLQFGQIVNSHRLKLERSETLIELKLPSLGHSDLHHIETCLKAAPNIEYLFVEELSKQILEFVALNLPRLKKLEYSELKEGDCLELYETLKRSDKLLNREIEIVRADYRLHRINDKVEQVLGTFLSRWMKLSIDPRCRTTVRNLY